MFWDCLIEIFGDGSEGCVKLNKYRRTSKHSRQLTNKHTLYKHIESEVNVLKMTTQVDYWLFGKCTEFTKGMQTL